MPRKTEQIQIRVTPAQKRALKRVAREAGQGVSAYVLARVLPEARLRFGELLRSLGRASDHRFPLAGIHDLLAGLTARGLEEAVEVDPREIEELSPFLANYVAAMVEHAAQRLGVTPPRWVAAVPPLESPWFATPLPGLRLHLLRASPVPFRRRNLFVDATVGDRV